MKKLTYEEYLLKARQVHGYKYEYPNLEQNFVNTSTKIPIICHEKDENGNEHGEFWQTPDNHLQGKGCSKCGKVYKYGTEVFIEKANFMHSNKYDYSRTNFIKASLPVEIICHEKDSEGNEHGSFFQRPNSHLRGCGCPKCGTYSVIKRLTLGKDKFITKSKEIHGNKFDYSKVEYINNRTKVCIICQEHGEFWQTPQGHLSGKGCPICGGSKKVTNEDFIKKAIQIHGNKYDYSRTKYVNANTPIIISCYVHGAFKQLPNVHLQSNGCYKCTYPNANMSTEEFIKKANEVHCGKYNYSKTEYVNIKSKLCIICPKHGEFWQTPDNHLKGCLGFAKIHHVLDILYKVYF